MSGHLVTSSGAVPTSFLLVVLILAPPAVSGAPCTRV